METLATYLTTHPTAAIIIYCLLGAVGLIAYFAKPLRERFPRYAGLVDVCLGLGPNAKQVANGLSLILFGKVPSSVLEGISLALKRWTKVGLVLSAGAWLALSGSFGCASASDAIKQAETVCPIPDRTVTHIKLGISLAKNACDSAPLTDEQLSVCNKAVESAETVLTTAKDVRAETCKAWPYIEAVNSLTSNEKLGAAVKLASTLLQCEASQ